MGAAPSHDAPTFVYSTAVTSPSSAPKGSIELCLVPLLRRYFNPEYGRTLKETFSKIYHQHQLQQHDLDPAAAIAADPEAANKMLMKLLVDVEVSFFSTAKVVLETNDLAREKSDAVEALRAAKREAERALFDLSEREKKSEVDEEEDRRSDASDESRQSGAAAANGVEVAPPSEKANVEAPPAATPTSAPAPIATPAEQRRPEDRKFSLLRPIPCAVCIIEPDRRKDSDAASDKNAFMVNGVSLLSSNAWTGIQGRRLHCVGYVSLFQPLKPRGSEAAAQAEAERRTKTPQTMPFLNEVTPEGIDLEFDIGLLHDDLDFLIDHIIFLASITFRSQYMTSVMAHVPYAAREAEDVYFRHFRLYNIHTRVPKLKHRVLHLLNTLSPLLELVDELGIGETEDRRRAESTTSRRLSNRRSRSRKPRPTEAKDAIYHTTVSHYPTFTLYGRPDSSGEAAEGVEVRMEGDLVARIMKYFTDSAAFETVKSSIVRCDMGPLLKERRYFLQVLQDAREEKMDSEDEEERLYGSEDTAQAIRQWIKDGDNREKQSKRDEKALRARMEQLQLQAAQQQQQQFQLHQAGLAAAAAAPAGMMMPPNMVTYIPGMGYVSVAPPGMMQQPSQQLVMMPQQVPQQPMFIAPQHPAPMAYPYMAAPQQQVMMMAYPGSNPYYPYVPQQIPPQAMPFYGRQPQVATMPPTPEQLAALQQQGAAMVAAAAAAAAYRGTAPTPSGQRPPSVAAESQASTTSNSAHPSTSGNVGAAMPTIKIGGQALAVGLQAPDNGTPPPSQQQQLQQLQQFILQRQLEQQQQQQQQQQHLLQGGAIGSEASAAGAAASSTAYMSSEAHPFQVHTFHEGSDYDEDMDGALAAASEALAALRVQESDDDDNGPSFEF